jgi:hypothetical protein
MKGLVTTSKAFVNFCLVTSGDMGAKTIIV